MWIVASLRWKRASYGFGYRVSHRVGVDTDNFSCTASCPLARISTDYNALSSHCTSEWHATVKLPMCFRNQLHRARRSLHTLVRAGCPQTEFYQRTALPSSAILKASSPGMRVQLGGCERIVVKEVQAAELLQHGQEQPPVRQRAAVGGIGPLVHGVQPFPNGAAKRRPHVKVAKLLCSDVKALCERQVCQVHLRARRPSIDKSLLSIGTACEAAELNTTCSADAFAGDRCHECAVS